MNRNDILNMPAGVTLDWHIAHFVMGLPSKELLVDDCLCAYCGSQMRYCGARSWCSECHKWRYTAYKDYSDDLVSAWLVVEKLCNENGCDVVKVCKRDPELLRGEWSCNFGLGFEAFGKTVPLAICRAALLATMELE